MPDPGARLATYPRPQTANPQGSGITAKAAPDSAHRCHAANQVPLPHSGEASEAAQKTAHHSGLDLLSMKKGSRQSLYVRLEQDIRNRLDAYADTAKLSRAAIVEHALRAYLDNSESLDDRLRKLIRKGQH